MVDMAVKEMAAGGTIELDDERKAQMASNLRWCSAVSPRRTRCSTQARCTNPQHQ